MSSTDSDTDPLARWSTTITLGAGKDHAVWSERQVFTWPEMAPRLTQHLPGLKDGLCYTPATFSGTRRQKLDAECIGVAALDVESGTNLEDAAKAIRKRGLAAAIATTFRHMMNESEVSAADFARFEEKTGTVEAPSRYLIERKGMLPAIAIGAVVMDQGEKTITIGHNPCPRFRVVMPLARPWLASAYPDQFKALDTWRGAVAALAHALGVQADPSGFDAAHLFYWPRYAPGGVPPQSLLITGKPVDIFSLPPAPKTTRTYAPRRGASEVAPDLPENITEARRWLAKEAPIATEGRQGDKRTYNVACELHDRGISEPLALEMLDEPGGWNSRCDPPWTLDDLEVKVRNAYRYCDNDFGSKTARSQGQAAFGHVKIEAPAEAEPAGEPAIITLDWWLARKLPPPEPMLGHFIAAGGFVFLGGATGEGKTQAAMAIAGALAIGSDLMHWQCHGQRRVLIVDGEMPNSLVAERLRDLHRRLGKPQGAKLLVLTRDNFPAMQPLNTEAGRAFILRKIEEIKPELDHLR